MRVLATGGAGYVGSKLVDFLLSDRHSVTILDPLLRGAGKDDAALHPDNPRVKHVDGDVRELPSMMLRSHDVVVHMAAIDGERACLDAPDDATGVNVGGTLRVLRLGLPTVLFSTCGNYGNAAREAKEHEPLKPPSLYGETKVLAERAVLEAGGCVLRIANVCGPSHNTRFDLLVNRIARAAVLRRHFSIYGLNTWRPHVHVSDVARAVAYLLRKGVPHGVWNLVGENLRKVDVGRLAKREFPDLQLTYSASRADRRDYRVSGAKIGRELSIYTVKNVRDGFNEVAGQVASGPEGTDLRLAPTPRGRPSRVSPEPR